MNEKVTTTDGVARKGEKRRITEEMIRKGYKNFSAGLESVKVTMFPNLCETVFPLVSFLVIPTFVIFI